MRERGREEGGREQRKTNCGGRCAPSPPAAPPFIVFIAACEPTALNSVRLLQRNDRRRDYTHPLPASPYQTALFVPNFHLFYPSPANFLPPPPPSSLEFRVFEIVEGGRAREFSTKERDRKIRRGKKGVVGSFKGKSVCAAECRRSR